MNNEVRPVRKVDASFCFAIFLSDFLHNFVDGIFIANAFLDCQQSKGWTVASSTVAHELAQEVSDFFMLVTRGGLTTIQALAVNVVSGASVVIGAWWFLWLEPGNGDRGMLLAFSGGVYVYVAATECAATFVHKNPTWRLKLLNVVLFIIGAGVGVLPAVFIIVGRRRAVPLAVAHVHPAISLTIEVVARLHHIFELLR